jgi:hypothetical protein
VGRAWAVLAATNKQPHTHRFLKTLVSSTDDVTALASPETFTTRGVARR